MKKVEELMPLLTLKEKVALVSGYQFMRTNAVPRLGIPSIKMSDGPHGLRAQPDGGDNGVTGSLPATCFPTASCSANTWRPELLKEMGNAMAEEAKHYGVSVILGPGVNIKRNPRCGRNFEYFSEDPFLAGRMGEAEVKGIQEKGIGVSLKHFACNNAENHRFMGNAVVDMRALREIYLRQFEHIVKSAKPETLMCSYNKINGVHSSENDWLLNKVLRDEWGFKGLVMSDWGATHDRVKGVRSGLDLEMPGDTDICRKWLFDAVNGGTLDIKDLDEAVKNVLTLVYNHSEKQEPNVDWAAHHALAKKIALEGAVLLKNDGILPLKENEEYLVVGSLFENARYQGAGSSMIHPQKKVTAKDAFDNNHIQYKYVEGYKENESVPNDSLIQEAVEASKGYEKVLLFVGLTDWFESEGADRDNIAMPQNQLALIDALAKEGKKLVVVLYGGSVMELPFFDKANGILNMLLSGQDSGEAAYDLLFGKANPSGKLTETWPLKYEDIPFGKEFSVNSQDVYKESIYVGYRYYLSANKEVRFPFGYGLSYTTFEYSNLKVEQKKNGFTATLDVTNTGKVDGAEAVQLYVSAPKGNTHKPLRELKGFAKVDLKAGETKSVSIDVSYEDLKYWNLKAGRFVLEEGEYAIQIGKNARDIGLEEKLAIKGESLGNAKQKHYESLDFASLTDAEFEKECGVLVPAVPGRKPITLESRLSDYKSTFLGRILYNSMQAVARKETKRAKKMEPGIERDNKLKGAKFLHIILDSNSAISLSMSSSGAFPYNVALGFAELANGHLIRGIKHFVHKIKAPALPINDKEGK